MKWEMAKASAKNVGKCTKTIHYLRGIKPNTNGRDYLSGGGRLLQLQQGLAAANLEGGERQGLSEARNVRGRIALTQGKLSDCSGGRSSCELCEIVGKCVGFAGFVRRALSGGGDIVRRSGRHVNGGKVVEDTKVLRMGRGLSGGEMGSKCCRSVEEGDGRARAGSNRS